MATALQENAMARLKSQMSRGELVLFTGAGFSAGARNRLGANLPTGGQLRRLLWPICFPDKDFEEQSQLGELYAIALRRSRKKLEELLKLHLGVDALSVPNWLSRYFTLPWKKIYTLNVDDLDIAVGGSVDLPRGLDVVSATSRDPEARGREAKGFLEVIHLNGIVGQDLEQLTFSESQYARRLGGQEPRYLACAADLLSRPIIFVGTTLQESLLWQHIEARKSELVSSRPIRPTSILVTQGLSSSRQAMLEELRIDWVDASAEAFSEDILSTLSQEAARGFTHQKITKELAGEGGVPTLVSVLAETRASIDTNYLLGADPEWSDILSGRAARRNSDEHVLAAVRDLLSGTSAAALVLSGTAGSGKSTALMQVAWSLVGEGHSVYWLDGESDFSISAIRRRLTAENTGFILAVDNADSLDRASISSLASFVSNQESALLLIAAGSTKVDLVLERLNTNSVPSVREFPIPALSDDDIDGLIGVLDEGNKLGILKGMSSTERRKTFQREAGRQLLVAMIQATSGKAFSDKIDEELLELEERQKYCYALVCLASRLGHFLYRDELLMACGGGTPDADLDALERLASRHLVRCAPPHFRYKPRHSLVADQVFKCLEIRGELADLLEGLAFSISTKVSLATDHGSRLWRLNRKLTNHTFLFRTLGLPGARRLFRALDQVANWNHHHWLQCGSLEVEEGDLSQAQNYIDQARSLAPNDSYVAVEHGYLLLRRARETSSLEQAMPLLVEGVEILDELCREGGTDNPYPFHVLGSQVLRFIQDRGLRSETGRDLLERVQTTIERGLHAHPSDQMLDRLDHSLRRERLLMVVGKADEA